MRQTKEKSRKGLLWTNKGESGQLTVCKQRRFQIFLNIGRMKEMPQIIGEKGKYGEQHTQRGYLARTVGSSLTGFLQVCEPCSLVMEIKEKV